MAMPMLAVLYCPGAKCKFASGEYAITTFRLFVLNLLWFVGCLPRLLTFLLARDRVKTAQLRILRNTLHTNLRTELGRRHGFGDWPAAEFRQRLPLTEYSDYAAAVARIRQGEPSPLTRDPVLLLEPTSGTTGTKLIPYTRGLQQQFQTAIAPWIAGLYLQRPRLLCGRHYWAISPGTTPDDTTGSAVPVGFAADADYLGPMQKYVSEKLFVGPRELRFVTHPESFRYLTLLYLVREHNLRLISIWHPSFFTGLLDELPRCWPDLQRDIRQGGFSDTLTVPDPIQAALIDRLPPDPRRAAELAEIDITHPENIRRLWPDLQIISCWTDGQAGPWSQRLAELFPAALLQGKGLVATEGIVSFPFGNDKVCAISSHFLEFSETGTGELYYAWELTRGKTYSVILTTAGGLYRYRLHDIVEVTGFQRGIPCLNFISRDNLTTDMAGEKIHLPQVEQLLTDIRDTFTTEFPFAMLAPTLTGDTCGYVLYLQEPSAAPDYPALAAFTESGLCRNYHYRHARNLGQLLPLRIFLICEDAVKKFRDQVITQGVKPGAVKITALHRATGWDRIFSGRFI